MKENGAMFLVNTSKQISNKIAMTITTLNVTHCSDLLFKEMSQ